MAGVANKEKLVYFTTPVFYPNDKPHLGHAFTVVVADILKRYHVSIGYKCFLSVGTDEHGEKIARTAEMKGMKVEDFLDQNVRTFKSLWEDLGIKYDKFIRTTDYAHKSLVKKIFEQYEQTNQIYFDNWQGWYCASCEEGYSFRSIEKTAECKLGHPLVPKNEETFFLRIRAFKAWLLKEYQDRENWIYPVRYKKEMINNFVSDLDDLSITRAAVGWGIPVPSKSEQVIYVWFDALISYLSVLNYGNYGKVSSDNFKTFWVNPRCRIVHIIGKEICRFHSIYWPIMLQNLGLRLFDTLLVHGWLLFDNEKMSKSKKNVVDPAEVLKKLPREALRFYLSRMNFLIDNHVCIDDIYSTYNIYLANTYGNLISRFYGLMKKFDLRVPDKAEIDEYIEIDQLNIAVNTFLEEEYSKLIVSFKPYALLDKIFDLFKFAGKLIEKNKAWELSTEDGLLRALVCTIYKLLCIGTWVLGPVLIDTAPEVMQILNVGAKKPSVSFFNQKKNYFGRQLNPLTKILFPRVTNPDAS